MISESNEIVDVLNGNSSSGPRGSIIDSFDDFTDSLSRKMMEAFPARAEAYITAVQQLCVNEAPDAVADCAVVLAYFFVAAPPSAQNRIGVANVVRIITDFCSHADASVRCRAVYALGIVSRA